MPCCRVARTFAGRIDVPRPFRLFRSMASATFLVGIRCRAQGCMQLFAAESTSGLCMTRDEGPPKDERLDREPPSLDEATRYREQSVVPSDSARDSESPPSLPSKRRAQGTHGDGQDDCTKSEAWLDAFVAQCTPELRECLNRYAARLLSGARIVSADSAAAQELVNVAIFDMLNGPDHWDFADPKRPLKLYLKNAIRWQVLDDFERANRLPHVSIEELTAQDHGAGAEALEQALRHERPDPSDVAYARERVNRLLRRAAGNDDVLALIHAKLNDRTSRADVMEVTGFSPQRYRTAVSQLNRMAHEVGVELDLVTGDNEDGNEQK
jgi:DNA-directed RNA polymerase specialized sigma24 family protein